MDGCFLAPPPPLLLHSRKVAGNCVGRALPAAPSLGQRAERVGEDRLSGRAFRALPLYPPMLDSASWDQASSTVGPLPSLLQRSRGGEGKALWTLPGLGRVTESSLLELGALGCVGKKPEALGAGRGIQLLSWLKAPWRSSQDRGRGLWGSHPYGLGKIPPLFPPCFPGQPCHLRP